MLIFWGNKIAMENPRILCEYIVIFTRKGWLISMVRLHFFFVKPWWFWDSLKSWVTIQVYPGEHFSTFAGLWSKWLIWDESHGWIGKEHISRLVSLNFAFLFVVQLENLDWTFWDAVWSHGDPKSFRVLFFFARWYHKNPHEKLAIQRIYA